MVRVFSIERILVVRDTTHTAEKVEGRKERGGVA
jgi:hypothetical protein